MYGAPLGCSSGRRSSANNYFPCESKLINTLHFKIYRQSVQAACNLIFVYFPSHTAHVLFELSNWLLKSHLKDYQVMLIIDEVNI